MSVDAVTLVTILGMAAATYAVRAGGFFLVRRLRPTPFVEAWLKQIPGAIFVALIAPAVLRGGPLYWVAAATTALVARASGNLLLSLAAGTAVVALGRLI